MKTRLCSALIFAALFFAQAAEETSYKVMILGDIHYDDPEYHKLEPTSNALKKEHIRNREMWKGPSFRILESAGQCAKEKSCSLAIQVGDLAQGDADTPELLGAMLEKAFRTVKSYFPDIPLLVVKGNHDIRGYGRTIQSPANKVLMPLVAKEIGEGGTGSNWIYCRGKDLYIGIDGFLPEKNCVAFVEKALREHPDTRYVFLVTHLPVIPAATDAPFWNLPGNFAIADLLEKRKTVILAGHTHTFSIGYRKSQEGTIAQIVTTSLGRDWLSGMEMKPSYEWPAIREAALKTVRGKKAEEMKLKVEAMDSKGEYSMRVYRHISGYVVLNVGDERVEAEIYTGEEKPALTEILLENRQE